MATCSDGDWVNEITCANGCDDGACVETGESDGGDADPTSCQTYDVLVVANGEQGCANDVSVAKCVNGEWREHHLCIYGSNQNGVCKSNKCDVECYDGYSLSSDGEYCTLAGDSCEVDDMGDVPSGITFCKDDNAYQCVDGTVVKGEPCECDHIMGMYCIDPDCPIEGSEYGCMSGFNCCKDAHTMASCHKGQWINEVTCDACGEGDCELDY